jgi:hypothetical protein
MQPMQTTFPRVRRYIASLSCKLQGEPASRCTLTSQWQQTLVFGGVQLLMSMLPNLER